MSAAVEVIRAIEQKSGLGQSYMWMMHIFHTSHHTSHHTSLGFLDRLAYGKQKCYIEIAAYGDHSLCKTSIEMSAVGGCVAEHKII